MSQLKEYALGIDIPPELYDYLHEAFDEDR